MGTTYIDITARVKQTKEELVVLKEEQQVCEMMVQELSLDDEVSDVPIKKMGIEGLRIKLEIIQFQNRIRRLKAEIEAREERLKMWQEHDDKT